MNKASQKNKTTNQNNCTFENLIQTHLNNQMNRNIK